MENNIQANRKIIKCMDMVNSFKKKKKNISDFIKMIKKKVLGYIIGQIIGFLQDFGKKENKMELVNLLKMIYINMVFGKMEQEKNGLIVKKILLILWNLKKKSLFLLLKMI